MSTDEASAPMEFQVFLAPNSWVRVIEYSAFERERARAKEYEAKVYGIIQDLNIEISMLKQELAEAREEIELYKFQLEDWRLRRDKATIDRLKKENESLKKEIERPKSLEKDHMDDWKRVQDAERKLENAKRVIVELRAALKEVGKWCTRETPEEPCTCIPHAALRASEEIRRLKDLKKDCMDNREG